MMSLAHKDPEGHASVPHEIGAAREALNSPDQRWVSEQYGSAATEAIIYRRAWTRSALEHYGGLQHPPCRAEYGRGRPPLR